jgi:hypothetical protein
MWSYFNHWRAHRSIEDTCVSSKRQSWKDHRNTSAWRSPSCLSPGRLTCCIKFLRPTGHSWLRACLDRRPGSRRPAPAPEEDRRDPHLRGRDVGQALGAAGPGAAARLCPTQRLPVCCTARPLTPRAARGRRSPDGVPHPLAVSQGEDRHLLGRRRADPRRVRRHRPFRAPPHRRAHQGRSCGRQGERVQAGATAGRSGQA